MLSLSLPCSTSRSRFRGSLLSIVAVTCSVFSLLSSNGWFAAVAFVAVLLLALQERMQPKEAPATTSRRYRTASIPDGGTAVSLRMMHKIGRAERN